MVNSKTNFWIICIMHDFKQLLAFDETSVWINTPQIYDILIWTMAYQSKYLKKVIIITKVLSDCNAAATWGELSVPSKIASGEADPLPVDSLRTPVTNHMIEGNTVKAPFGEQSAGRRERARTVAAINWALRPLGIKKS